jgi:hypothetical protein
LEMTDAQRPLQQEMQDAQAGLIGQQAVELGKLHARNIPLREYTCKRIYMVGMRI